VATTPLIAVTNTSPVIALAGVGLVSLLQELFDKVIVPFAVWDELVDKPGAPEPAMLAALSNVTLRPALGVPSPDLLALGAGEASAIMIASTIPDSLVLLDDAAGRKLAARLGLTVRGTLGMLMQAKAQGLITHVKPYVTRMIADGRYFDPGLLEEVLKRVAE